MRDRVNRAEAARPSANSVIGGVQRLEATDS